MKLSHAIMNRSPHGRLAVALGPTAREKSVNLFSKLFGDSKVREGRKLLAEAQTTASMTYGPLGRLSMSIVCAADSAHKELAPILGISIQAEPSEERIYIFYEFLYFFSHLTLRSAIITGLTESQIKKLQGFLGPLLASTAIDSFFRHWPEDLKEKLIDEFYAKLNDAEIEYSECDEVMSEDHPFDSKTIFGKLANNVSILHERPSDPEIMAPAFVAAANAFTVMQLDRCIREVADVIDELNPEV